MKNIKILKTVMLGLACIGILVFWIAGMNDYVQVAKYATIGAGVFSWLALILDIIDNCRTKNGCY